MKPELWDPLVWFLKCKEWALRARGFEHRQARLDNHHSFNYYFREGDRGFPVLVLIHGLALFPEWWAPLLPKLSRCYSLCIPELLGFGRSPGRSMDPAGFTLALFRRQIAHLKEVIGWDNAIVSGVSLGGWVAMDYALHDPDGVKGLILIAPAGADPDVREEDLLKLKEIFDYDNAAGFRRLMNEYVLFKPRWIPGFVGSLAVKRSRWNGHKHFLNHLTFPDWIGARAFDLKMPVGMVWGCEDRVFPISTGFKLDAALTHARLFPLENTGHSYLFETPETSSRAILDALKFIEREQERDTGTGQCAL
ncbi:MAG: alpha/beta hydrolase [Planctomycetota bacterium]